MVFLYITQQNVNHRCKGTTKIAYTQIFRYFFRKAFFSRFCYATLSVLFISKLSMGFLEIIVGRLAVNPRLYSGQSATLMPLSRHSELPQTPIELISNSSRRQVELLSGFYRGL